MSKFIALTVATLNCPRHHRQPHSPSRTDDPHHRRLRRSHTTATMMTMLFQVSTSASTTMTLIHSPTSHSELTVQRRMRRHTGQSQLNSNTPRHSSCTVTCTLLCAACGLPDLCYSGDIVHVASITPPPRALITRIHNWGGMSVVVVGDSRLVDVGRQFEKVNGTGTQQELTSHA